MEVAPDFWQSPETLKDIYVSTSGGASAAPRPARRRAAPLSSPARSSASAAGRRLRRQHAGRYGLRPVPPARPSGRSASCQDAVRNQQLNALATSARGGASTGASVSTKVETMVPLSAFATFGPGTTPLAVNHQGVVRRHHLLLQPAGGRAARARRWPRSTAPWPRSMCRSRSMATSPAPRSCSRSPSPTCRCCSWRRS